MQESNFFYKLNINSTITDTIFKKVENAKPDEWSVFLDQTIYKLSKEDFITDLGIYQAIDYFQSASRLAVYKFDPNTCFKWHVDKIRYSSINMVIDGFDSFCAFGIPNASNMTSNLITGVHKLEHKPNTYYVINVKKQHTVFNFNKRRYLLSIGIQDLNYESVLSYFFEKNLIDPR
jgi:hypothetical protein